MEKKLLFLNRNENILLLFSMTKKSEGTLLLYAHTHTHDDLQQQMHFSHEYQEAVHVQSITTFKQLLNVKLNSPGHTPHSCELRQRQRNGLLGRCGVDASLTGPAGLSSLCVSRLRQDTQVI